jgi:hypothetical protein
MKAMKNDQNDKKLLTIHSQEDYIKAIILEGC